MKRKLIAVASAAMIGLTAVANQVEARWRGGGWWIPGAIVESFPKIPSSLSVLIPVACRFVGCSIRSSPESHFLGT
jgi:hypothetical protein